eukprot:gene5028-6821_t
MTTSPEPPVGLIFTKLSIITRGPISISVPRTDSSMSAIGETRAPAAGDGGRDHEGERAVNVHVAHHLGPGEEVVLHRPGQRIGRRIGAARRNGPEMLRAAVFAQRVASPNLRVELTPPTPQVSLMADGRMIGQVLTNVLKNAAEAVEARCATMSRHKGAIRARLLSDETGVTIEVEDNGVGLPAKDRDRLTEPYVTTREKGTGLGLAIVKRILEDHGGELELTDARRGQGALVILVGAVDLRDPGGPIFGAQAYIARDHRQVTHFWNGVGAVRTAVAVDHQPRIALRDEGGVQGLGQALAQPKDADVPGDVPAQVRLRESEVSQNSGNDASCVIAQQQKGRWG